MNEVLLPPDKPSHVIHSFSWAHDIFANIKDFPLDEEHFEAYKHGVNSAFARLETDVLGIQNKLQALPAWVWDKKTITDIFSTAIEHSVLLTEYVKSFGHRNPSSWYKFLWDICHSTKDLAEQTKKFALSDAGDKNIIILLVNEFVLTLVQKISQLKNLTYWAEEMYDNGTFSPASSIDEILETEKSAIQAKFLNVYNTITISPITSYPQIFAIAMQNIISNAVKFTPEHWTITIGVNTMNDKDIVFFVEDTGIGVDDTVDIFFSGYTTPSPDGQVWTWVWLKWVKTFVETIGGTITHRKWAHDKWTRFLISLPIVKLLH